MYRAMIVGTRPRKPIEPAGTIAARAFRPGTSTQPAKPMYCASSSGVPTMCCAANTFLMFARSVPFRASMDVALLSHVIVSPSARYSSMVGPSELVIALMVTAVDAVAPSSADLMFAWTAAAMPAPARAVKSCFIFWASQPWSTFTPLTSKPLR